MTRGMARTAPTNEGPGRPGRPSTSKHPLAQALRKLGWSQWDLSLRVLKKSGVNIHPQKISLVFTGRTKGFTPSQAYAILDVLPSSSGVTIHHLLGVRSAA